MFARVAIIFSCIFFALNVQAGEFELANRFLDAFPLASSDGQHDALVLAQIQNWTNKKPEQQKLSASLFAFSAIQVLRQTKLVAVISPLSVHGDQVFDLRMLPIWQQIMAQVATNEHVTVIEYISVANVNVNTKIGAQAAAFKSPSYIFINSSFAKKDQIVSYFTAEQRNVNYHPKNDIYFVLEGYIFGYTFDNIRSYYAEPSSNRKLPFDKVNDAALSSLPKFYVADVSELSSGHQKFSVLNSK